MNMPSQNKSDPVKPDIDKSVKKIIKKKNVGMQYVLNRLTLLLVVILFVGAGAAYYMFQRMQQDIAVSIKTLQTNAASLQDQMTHVTQTSEQQKQITAENRTAIERIQKFTNKQKYNWVLAEAGYLAEMANLNLRFEHNIPKAIALLKTADSHLRSSDIQNIINVRKILISDIVALQAIPKVDTSGLYLYLQSIGDQIDRLPLVNIDYVSAAAASKNAAAKKQADLSSWKKALTASWQGIKQVLIIHHYKKSIRPVLSVKQRALLVLNLHILITQTQWALLHGQNTIYLSNLKHIQNKIKQHFLHTNIAIKQILVSLTELGKIKIAPKVPDISDSVHAIQGLNQTEMKIAVSIARSDKKSGHVEAQRAVSLIQPKNRIGERGMKK